MAEKIPYLGRLEDERLATGRGRYVADLRMPRLAHAYTVRSVYAHAKINGIDTAAARAAPGVLAVLTAADLAADGIGNLPCGVQLPKSDGEKAHQASRPVLAGDRVRYVGDCVVLVVAETVEQAEAAGETRRDRLCSARRRCRGRPATTAGAPAVWVEVPTTSRSFGAKNDLQALDAVFADAAMWPADLASLPRHACSMEPRGALGLIDDSGRFVLHASNQSHSHEAYARRPVQGRSVDGAHSSGRCRRLVRYEERRLPR